MPVLVSGSMLMRLPLEYLTNRKIREMYYNGNQYTYLTFGVKHGPKKERPVVEDRFYRKFLNLQ